MEFAKKFKDTFTFSITQVIGLTNDDEVSKEFRPYKQMIERLNRTYKASYRPTNGFDNYDGANNSIILGHFQKCLTGWRQLTSDYNICNFQGSIEPFCFGSFFHRSFDTILY